MPHSVFISYRRDGGEMSAQMFYMLLSQRGYRVFYDIETLGVGVFNDKILREIEEAEVFLVILSKGALDRCANEGDWVRREIAHALSLGKPVIPLIFRGFEFPAALPKDIQTLPYYNGVNITDMQYFDAKVEHLARMIDLAAGTYRGASVESAAHGAKASRGDTPTAASTAVKTAAQTSVQQLKAWNDEGRQLYEQQHYEKAIDSFRRAAEGGYAGAQFNLGLCYQTGCGVAKDPALAVEWYRRAAEQGLADALCNLGFCYQKGLGVKKDEACAFDYYSRAAERGQTLALYRLADCHYYGTGTAKDLARAAVLYRQAAEQGYVWAQYSLGWCYEHGHGVAKVRDRAIEWYRRAAEQGHEPSQKKLRHLAPRGEVAAKERKVTPTPPTPSAASPAPQKEEKPERWNAEGERLFDNKQYGEAVSYFRRAAEQGLAAAQNNLGVCCYHGYGTEQNAAQAAVWFRRAAEQGLAAAQYNLGQCYEYGHGVARVKERAIEWYRRAAAQGFAQAKEKLQKST